MAANLLDNEERKVTDRIEALCHLHGSAPRPRRPERGRGAKVRRPFPIVRRPMSRVMRRSKKGEPRGFMKAIVDEESRRILGATIFGIDGDEAIHGLPLCHVRGRHREDATRERGYSPDRVGVLLTLLGDPREAVVSRGRGGAGRPEGGDERARRRRPRRWRSRTASSSRCAWPGDREFDLGAERDDHGELARRRSSVTVERDDHLARDHVRLRAAPLSALMMA